jgi:fatty-acid desaturase
MNTFFYKVWLPLKLLTVIFLLLFLFDYTTINWWMVFVSWFLLGPVGIGVGFHKLFSHRQFETYKPVEYTIAVLILAL